MQRGALLFDVGTWPKLDHREGDAVGRSRAAHRAQRGDRQCDGALVEREIDETYAPDDPHGALAGVGAELRIVAGGGA